MFKWLLFVHVTVTVVPQGRVALVQATAGKVQTSRLPGQCGEKPVARLQPTTGVMSHICKREGAGRQHWSPGQPVRAKTDTNRHGTGKGPKELILFFQCKTAS